MRTSQVRAWLGAAVLLPLVAAPLLILPVAGAAGPQVLRVGSWHNVPGQYHSVQAAVRAAHPGDWVLVGPGDYKESGYPGAPEPAGVLITTPDVHLRGMDRNGVVVDGTRPGSPTCSAAKGDQVITPHGRDGVMALEVDGVSIENLTTCNYLTGSSGGEGNEIWFNGGDGSGKIGMGAFRGDYLTATSTYSNGVNNPRGEYGVFTSNADGPGVVDHSYASNMGDAAYYIGACPDCNQVLNHAHGQFSALGYSGTNSGGHLVIENSEFDHNKTGATTNSQNNDDAPSPQDGSCPGGEKGPLGIGICNIWQHNYFHDNNNPNVPGAGAGGLAGGAPVGTGFVFAGTHNVALYQNRVEHNDAWGVVVTDLPDQEDPPTDIGQNCQGGTSVTPPGSPGGALCYFDALGNAVMGNTFTDNGSLGNYGNGDIAVFAKGPDDPGNCVQDNTDPNGLTTTPAQVQQNPLFDDCSTRQPNANPDVALAAQLNCATQLLAPCPDNPAATYPQTSRVVLHMPPPQQTMPDPCAGVPANPWCPAAATSSNIGATPTAARSGSLAATGLDGRLPLAAVVLAGAALGLRRWRRLHD